MELVAKLHDVLNLIKDFTAGYSTRNMDKGLMMAGYKGKRYAVKAGEIKTLLRKLLMISTGLSILFEEDYVMENAKWYVRCTAY